MTTAPHAHECDLPIGTRVERIGGYSGVRGQTGVVGSLYCCGVRSTVSRVTGEPLVQWDGQNGYSAVDRRHLRPLAENERPNCRRDTCEDPHCGGCL